MTHYVCEQLSDTTPQTCVSWVESQDWTQTLAITQSQAAGLLGAYSQPLAYALVFAIFVYIAKRA